MSLFGSTGDSSTTEAADLDAARETTTYNMRSLTEPKTVMLGHATNDIMLLQTVQFL